MAAGTVAIIRVFFESERVHFTRVLLRCSYSDIFLFRCIGIEADCWGGCPGRARPAYVSRGALSDPPGGVGTCKSVSVRACSEGLHSQFTQIG